jgi:Mce-associated membrane protein
MPPRKRTSSVLNGDAKEHPTDGLNDADEATARDEALALAEEAEAEAVEAEAAAAAARARARAIRLRRQAGAAANGASAKTPAVAEPAEVEQLEVEQAQAVELDEPDSPETETADESAEATAVDDAITADAAAVDDAITADAAAADDDTEDDDEAAAEPARRRRLKLPRLRLKVLAAALVIICTLGLLGVSGFMIWHHRQVAAEQQRSAEFAAAARQGVVTLMSLNFNHAKEDVQRIIDNTTGDFKKDFEGSAPDFTKVAQESKVITEATVNATAVQSMTKDTANVLVAVTTRVSNTASKEQQPRSWRLAVDVARDGGQIKLAKVEFVP